MKTVSFVILICWNMYKDFHHLSDFANNLCKHLNFNYSCTKITDVYMYVHTSLKCVCVCVSMCIFKYVCMYVCMYICVCVCVCVCVYVCMYVCVCVCVCVCMYVCMYVWGHPHVTPSPIQTPFRLTSFPPLYNSPSHITAMLSLSLFYPSLAVNPVSAHSYKPSAVSHHSTSTKVFTLLATPSKPAN